MNLQFLYNFNDAPEERKEYIIKGMQSGTFLHRTLEEIQDVFEIVNPKLYEENGIIMALYQDQGTIKARLTIDQLSEFVPPEPSMYFSEVDAKVKQEVEKAIRFTVDVIYGNDDPVANEQLTDMYVQSFLES